MSKGRQINAQRALLNKIRGRYSAYNANGAEDATIVQEVATIPVVQDQKLVTVHQGMYNPPFKAQIQINFLKYYFSYAGGVFAPVAAGAVPAALQLALPTFLFSNSDFASGFAKLQGQFPVAGWAYGGAPFVYNKASWPGTPASGIFDANVRNLLRAGDLVIPFTGSNGGTDYVAIAVIRTSDVPYGTLLDALNSNTFNINLLRYTVTLGQETQFANAILCADETMFGKFSSDPINPESFKNPEQDQDNIIDIDVDFPVNKQRGLATYVNYDVVSFRWNLFISSANKIV